ncbi:MAG TPA: rod shape-determining protein MreD [Oscillospiraceae bacterium]|nr:rod shape-determining protein MreD [Oscillospiraceae bacterium]
MAALLIFVLFISSLVLQGSVLALAGPSGVQPDILLVVTVALALLADARRGAIVGLCAGLAQDILFGSPLGFFALSKMLVGTTAGLLSSDINKELTLSAMVLMPIFTIISDLISFILLKLYQIQFPLPLLTYLKQVTLPHIAMHFLIMGIIYPFLFRAQKRNLLFAESEAEEWSKL